MTIEQENHLLKAALSISPDATWNEIKSALSKRFAIDLSVSGPAKAIDEVTAAASKPQPVAKTAPATVKTAVPAAVPAVKPVTPGHAAHIAREKAGTLAGKSEATLLAEAHARGRKFLAEHESKALSY